MTVKEKDLASRLLVHPEDRLATDRGELQILGVKKKDYPALKLLMYGLLMTLKMQIEYEWKLVLCPWKDSW